ncbi:MAG: hypothetical protein J6S82_07600 [Bacteroidales bacterium]|nr:hypothetical protein [Bacteroidales bacterium]
MIFFNLFRAPKNKVNTDGKPFLKQVGMIVLSTTISLALTLGVLQLLDKQSKKNDRRLSALMVMGNIEDFTRGIDAILIRQQRCDSLCTWLLSIPEDELGLIPEKTLMALMSEALSGSMVVFDKAAENIFSNNIETWKNMGNFQFINNAGDCFSRMHNIEDYWNNRLNEEDRHIDEISKNPEQYPGENIPVKWLRDPGVRKQMEMKHNWNCWLRYQAEYLRYMNKKNMNVIGIPQEELIEFMEDIHKEIVIKDTMPNGDDFYTPALKPENLQTLHPYQRLLDSLKADSLKVSR